MQATRFVPGAAAMRQRRSWLSGLALMTVTLMATILGTGCSSEEETPEATAQVSGTVTVKGRPVSSAVVSLVNAGVSWKATLDKQGKFQIAEPLPPGTYLVYLNAQGGGTHPTVPVKYQSDTSTDYTVDVQPGSNDLKIELQ